VNRIRQFASFSRITAATLKFNLASLILIACVLSAARLAFPLIENYHHHLADLLSHQLGYQVNFSALSLRLSGWQPRLHFTNLQLIKLNTNTPAFTAQALELDLDVLGSWRNKTPQFKNFTLIAAQLTLLRQRTGQWSLLGFEALPLAQPDVVTRFLDQGQINLTDSWCQLPESNEVNNQMTKRYTVK
jgi:uncharacterized protein YhdP